MLLLYVVSELVKSGTVTSYLISFQLLINYDKKLFLHIEHVPIA